MRGWILVTARKNILSWLKGMKGRLSAILQKPPKEKEKNLQSTVTEKRFSSLNPESETADRQTADAEKSELADVIRKIFAAYGCDIEIRIALRYKNKDDL